MIATSDYNTAALETETASVQPSPMLSPDDDFDQEELGERQPEACSNEAGCTVCG